LYLELMGFEELENSDWFGIRVKSRCEVRAHDDLRQRGFEAFLPLCSVRRRWSDRVKTLQAPMFRGYLFCKFALPDRIRILNAECRWRGPNRGVRKYPGPYQRNRNPLGSDLGGFQSRLYAVALSARRPTSVHRLDDGPLAGVEGVIVRAEDGKPRVVVSIAMLFRSVAAEIERDWISRVEEDRPRAGAAHVAGALLRRSHEGFLVNSRSS
jgi:hypothetical protein